MRAPPLAALLAAFFLAVGVDGAAVNTHCETLTGLPGCLECAKVGAGHQCFLCHKSTVADYKDGKITRCRDATTGTECTSSSGDANCLRCNGVWCVECKPNFYFDANFVCRPGKFTTHCQQMSKNPKCASCNPDGSCNRCANANHVLVPLNAMFINVIFQESQCMTRDALNAEARRLTFSDAFVPANCIEVDTEFKCCRCRDNYSLTGGECRPLASGSKCPKNLRYQQYCDTCNANGLCTKCNGSRSLFRGQCSLPCKQLFGITCSTCTAARCTQRDPKYANGRR